MMKHIQEWIMARREAIHWIFYKEQVLLNTANEFDNKCENKWVSSYKSNYTVKFKFKTNVLLMILLLNTISLAPSLNILHSSSSSSSKPLSTFSSLPFGKPAGQNQQSTALFIVYPCTGKSKTGTLHIVPEQYNSVFIVHIPTRFNIFFSRAHLSSILRVTNHNSLKSATFYWILYLQHSEPLKCFINIKTVKRLKATYILLSSKLCHFY